MAKLVVKIVPIEAYKKEGENSQSLIRRFVQKVQRSGILVRARSLRFHKPEDSKGAKKQFALRREELKKEYEKSMKMGKPVVKQFRKY